MAYRNDEKRAAREARNARQAERMKSPGRAARDERVNQAVKASREARQRAMEETGSIGGKLIAAVGVLFAFALCVGLAFFVFNSISFSSEEPGEVLVGQEISVEVAEGASASEIAYALKDAGVIEYAGDFLDRVTELDVSNSLKPGLYYLIGGADIDELIDTLVAGETGYTFTIPEGYTLKQIAKVVAKNTDVTAKEFKKACKDASVYASEFSFLEEVGTKKLEGCLFPSTYTVSYNATAEDIVRLMLQTMEDKLGGVNMEYASSKNLTPYDILILASIVEKEYYQTSDLAKIASVFYNRLHNGMALGSDVTTYYAVGKALTEELTNEDLASDSPYNTRNSANTGLIPTPICSPSIDAIEAAANPDETDYLYFFYSASQGEIMYFASDTEFASAWAVYGD